MANSILPKVSGKAYSSVEVRQTLAMLGGIYPEISDVLRLAQTAIAQLEQDKLRAAVALSLDGNAPIKAGRVQYAISLLGDSKINCVSN